jgi:integrase
VGGEEASRECPECHSKKVWKDGLRETNSRFAQRFICRDCGFRFSEKSNIASATNRKRQLSAILREAKKLDTATETKTVAGEENPDVKGKLVQFAFYMQREGMANSTVLSFGRAIMRLAKIANLNEPESVKEALAKLNIAENTKVSYCVAYSALLRFLGKTWKMPKYTYHQTLLEFIPTEEEIDQLIAGIGKKVATLLQLMKETGMRLGECLSLTWTSVNFQSNVVTLTVAEKHSLPRIFRVSSNLMSMLGNLPKQNKKVFGRMTAGTATVCLLRGRKKVAIKVGNPRIAKIHYHLIRHWFGTMECHKTHDIDHVRRRLGHRSVLNTQIYINMEQTLFTTKSDDYHVKVASTIEEACKLIEVGFEYVTEIEGRKLFRKRK